MKNSTETSNGRRLADRSLGLESGVVRLVKYRPEWKQAFVDETTRLREALGTPALEVEHMGSTAIEGMIAKPILDLMIAVKSLPRSLELVPLLASLGYEHHPEDDVEERHFFVKRRPDGEATHHLSLVEFGCHFWMRQLAFRDYLRAHPDVSAEYATLKRSLRFRYGKDRPAYVEGKTDFVEKVLVLAGCGPLQQPRG